jgi:hypothetical protein
VSCLPACVPVWAGQEKGFEVTVLPVMFTLDALKAALANANQVWLISASSNLLSEDMLAAIVEEWRAGMGVYVFGDNEPYYADANRLLKVRVRVCLVVVTYRAGFHATCTSSTRACFSWGLSRLVRCI